MEARMGRNLRQQGSMRQHDSATGHVWPGMHRNLTCLKIQLFGSFFVLRYLQLRPLGCLLQSFRQYRTRRQGGQILGDVNS